MTVLAFRAGALVLSLALSLQAGAAAAPGPTPPCDGTPEPAFPAAGEPERSGIWTTSDLGASWIPPSCTGWTGTDFRLIVAVAARIGEPLSSEQLLSRFGSISSLVGLRYWSATEHRLKELVTAARAVQDPAGKQPRADFALTELRPGNSIYFSQTDNRSSGTVIYKMTVLAAEPDRVVIGIENVSSIRLLLITLFPPGSVQTMDFMERQRDGSWGYYSLVRTRASSSMLTGTYLSSYVNRAVAFFRHIAGIPEAAQPAMTR
jgi:uncharacterized protein DUF6675